LAVGSTPDGGGTPLPLWESLTVMPLEASQRLLREN
jgi:hypothetical protein